MPLRWQCAGVLCIVLLVLARCDAVGPDAPRTAGGDRGGGSTSNDSNDSSNSDSRGAEPLASSGSHSDPGCIPNAGQAKCADYAMSDEAAYADLSALCAAQPGLSACSLARLCSRDGLDQAWIGRQPRTCDPVMLLASACEYDSLAAGAEACATYSALCLTPNTVVQQCNRTSGLGTYLVPTAAALQLSSSLCLSRASDAAHCKRCDFSGAPSSCDAVGVYSALCMETPARSECVLHERMCSGIPTGDSQLYLCRQQLADGTPSRPGEQVWTSWSSSLQANLQLSALLALAALCLQLV